MDVVYVFRHSQFDDLELRYSLRSVAKYLPWIRKVWIFGDRPEFLSDEWSTVEHIPWEAVAWFGHFQTPITNHFLQYYLLSLWPELDQEFLVFHDDHILLNYLPVEVAKRNRIIEDMSDVKSRGEVVGRWRQQLWRSFDWWKRLGYPTFNFESHTPRHMTKRRLFDAYAAFRDYVTEDRYQGMIGPSGVLNHALRHEGISVTRRDDENLTVGFNFKPALYDDVVKHTKGKTFLFFDERAFGPDLHRYLAERYPEPCVYESAADVSDSRRYDVLYFMAESKWGEELKYSLRSFEEYFPQLGKVWIFGHLPDYIDPAKVMHIPEPQWSKPPVFVESAALRVVNDQVKGLSEDFILAQDDNYLLRAAKYEDFGPLQLENMDEVKNRGVSPWKSMLWRTFDLLKFMGHSVYNYESHTPHQFNRTQLRAISQKFLPIELAATHRYHSVCIRTAYWNILLDASPKPVRKAVDYRVGFVRPEDSATVEQIASDLEGRLLMYHDDAGLSDALKSFLATRYPNKSKFER